MNNFRYEMYSKQLGLKRQHIVNLYLLTIILSIVLFYYFTRFEALSAKTAIEPYNDLSFEVQSNILNINSRFDAYFSSFLSWLSTNRNGMLFGLWMSAIISELFTYTRQVKKKGSTLLGVVSASALGLCINCAAPLLATKKKNDISDYFKALVIGSHAFNVFVLIFMFTTLPLEYGVIKLLSVLTIIFFVTRNKSDTEDINLYSDERVYSLTDVVKNLVSKILFLGKTFLIFTVVGGALGVLLYINIPHEYFLNIKASFMSISLVSLIASLLPVPLVFDVILVSHLKNMNVDPNLLMPLLLSLGPCSVIVLFTINKIQGMRKAAGFLILVNLVVIVFSAIFYQYNTFKENNDYEKLFAVNLTDFNNANIQVVTPEVLELSACNIKEEFIRIDSLLVKRFKLCPNLKESQNISTNQLGLFEIEKKYYTNINDLNYFNLFPHVLAAGDYNNDHWVDLLISVKDETYLYQNIKGKHFKRIEFPLNKLGMSIALFVDIDNDSKLDIIGFPYFSDQMYVLKNRKNQFTSIDTVTFNNDLMKKGFVNSVSIGQFDDNPLPELFLGYYTPSINDLASLESDRNYVVFNMSELRPVDVETPGKTMSSVISDLNNDGLSEIIIGNDYNVPDQILEFDKKLKAFKLNKSFQLEKTSKSTMSIVSNDFDLDGDFDLFFTDMSSYDDLAKESFCEELDVNQTACLALEKLYKDVSKKEKCDDSEYPKLCKRLLISQLAMKYRSERFCNLLPRYEVNSCISKIKYKIPYQKNYFPNADSYEQVSKNVLLINEGSIFKSVYENKINPAYWAWNTIIADFDNDGDKDIHIVNGDNILTPHTPNVFIDNDNDLQILKDIKKGKNSYVDSRSSLSLDINNDGVLDIISGNSLTSPSISFGSAKSQSIQFSIKGCLGCRVIGKRENKTIFNEELNIGGGYRSFGDNHIHIGAKTVDKLMIYNNGKMIKEINHTFDAGYRYIIAM